MTSRSPDVPSEPASRPPVPESVYLSRAIAIARQLTDAALPADCGVTWDTDDLIGDQNEHTVYRRRCGADFYGGASGIAWFLGHIAQHDPTGAFAAAAADGLRFALAEAGTALASDDASFLVGSTGVAFSAIAVADRLGLEALRQSALSLAKESALRVHRSAGSQRDFIAGDAGAVIGLLALHRACGEPLFLDAAVKACDRLMESGVSQWWGRSWPEDSGAPALCGLGHGMSGIAWALSETAWAAREPRFRTCAEEVFRYERSWFSPDRCAWPDLREPDARSMADGTWPSWMTAWCHGAFGIGAVRLRIYEATGDTTALAEASAAVQAGRFMTMRTGLELRNGQLGDTSVCHGLSGAAELFLLAHEVFESADHLRAARRVGDLCLDTYEKNGRQWTFGVRGGEQVPGLFLGLAGTGATLMRLHDPASIGSPLLPGRSLLARGVELRNAAIASTARSRARRSARRGTVAPGA